MNKQVKRFGMYDAFSSDMVNEFGAEHQVTKAVEELAELIVAISKGHKDSIVEELADVQLMINQLLYIYKIPQNDIAMAIANKIARTYKRLK